MHEITMRWAIALAMLCVGPMAHSAEQGESSGAAALPAPSSDPRDFNGIWQPPPASKPNKVADADGGKRSADVIPYQIRPTVGAREDGSPPYNVEGEQIFRYRQEMEAKGTPVARPATYCHPLGVIDELSLPIFRSQFLQKPDVIVHVFEEWHELRTIYMNQEHPKDLLSSYMGHSAGHWDGDTLVIDTIGFNGKTWLDHAGSPTSARLHLIEHMKKIEGGTMLEDTVTIEDPEYYTRPFTARFTYRWRPDLRMPELTCEEAMRAVIVNGLLFQ
jgi:hypothetical protein